MNKRGSVVFLFVMLAACMVRSRANREPPITATIQLAHPSASATLEPNTFGAMKWDSDRSNQWYSLTELTNERICVDFGFTEVRATPGVVDTYSSVYARSTREAREQPMVFRAGGRQTTATIAEHNEPVVVDSRAGTTSVTSDVRTGRVNTVCVEDQVNQYGTVVGCRRYEEQDQTQKVTNNVAATVSTIVGGLRFCAPNKGTVAADTTAFDIVFSYFRYRIVLAGGAAKQGAWGAHGGRSALEKAQPVVAVATPTPAAPDGLAVHASASLEISPFKLVGPDGKTVAEMTPGRELRIHDTVTARFTRNGLVSERGGRPVLALDRDGVIRQAFRAGISEMGKISGNALTEANGSVLTYERGRFTYKTAKGTKSSTTSIVPASTSPKLALLAGYVLATALRLK